MERVDRTVELAFRTVPYIIEVKADEQHLLLLIEEKESGKRWRGDFSSQYIEEITQKTGNFKKFVVFVRMLMTAIENSSESVFIDLLTYQDLEMLKSRKKPLGSTNSANTSTMSTTNPKLMNKRYLILTYAVEFDRVHYPLPLLYEETPDVETLQRTIVRLRTELEDLKKLTSNGSLDTEQLLKENESLRQQIARLEHAQSVGSVARKGAVEIDSIYREKKLLEEECDRIRTDSNREIRKLKKLNEDLENELDKVRKEMDDIISKLEAESDERLEMRNMKNRIQELTKDLEYSRKSEEKAKKELNACQEELDTLIQSDRKQKQRIKQLESELETANKSRGTNTRVRNISPSNRSSSGSSAKREPARVNRSPAGSRITTPPSLRNGDRGRIGRPSSDRNSRGYSPGSRNTSPGNRVSPGVRKSSPGSNRHPSPGMRVGQRNTSPGGRLVTPPGAKRSSPGYRRQSPGNTSGSRFSRSGHSSDSETDKRVRKPSPKSNVDVASIDARLHKLQQLLKFAKA
jgi:coiled-coil domain-containing protein 61